MGIETHPSPSIGNNRKSTLSSCFRETFRSIYPWAAARAEPLTSERLSNHRALILLGEPGMGKSMTLQEEHPRLTQGSASGVTSLRVDLRAFSSEDLLYRRIFESQERLEIVGNL